jgi:CRISPR-associated endonuclease/helicase Cas3
MSEGILLNGLDGSNPLAFLAALGTLRTLSLALPNENVRMSWEHSGGAWRPRVWCSIVNHAHQFITNLDHALVKSRSLHPTAWIKYNKNADLLNPAAVEFYQAVRAGDPVSSESDAWIGALTNDIHREATSPLQLTRSDYFTGNLDQVIANTTADHLYQSLFETWTYGDALAGQSMHWEPTEDRRHAYQWDQPSGDPNRNKSGNMLGANRLAIEALPLFLGLPSNNPKRLLMTGWSGVRSDDARWTWPIWTTPINLCVLKSVLSMQALQEQKPDVTTLRSYGIAALFRTRRILVEKTPNLTPPTAIP